MSKDNSEYKKSLQQKTKGIDNNSKMKPLADRIPNSSDASQNKKKKK